AADGVGGELRLHCRIAEQQLARRVEERDGVLQMFDRGLQVRLLSREERAVRRQLLTDRVEERPEVPELVVLIEIERDAELAFAKPREPAADHVDWPEEQLREQRG